MAAMNQPSGAAPPAAERGTFVVRPSETDRADLLKLGGIRKFARGEHLMHQGEPGDRVLILLRGHAKATFVDDQGHQMILRFLGPGDVLGELSFARAEPRSSNVIAIEAAEARALAASSSGVSTAATDRGIYADRRSQRTLPRRRPQADSVRLFRHGRSDRRSPDRAMRALWDSARRRNPDRTSHHAGRPRRLGRVLARGRGGSDANDERARLDPNRAPRDHGHRSGGAVATRGVAGARMKSPRLSCDIAYAVSRGAGLVARSGRF